MKNLNEKSMLRRMSLSLIGIAAAAYPVFAASGTFQSVVQPVVDLLDELLGPLLLIVGAVGTLYCVLLGVKYARAEEPQDREKAKQHLKSALIGFILIFVMIVILNRLMPILSDWASKNRTTI